MKANISAFFLIEETLVLVQILTAKLPAALPTDIGFLIILIDLEERSGIAIKPSDILVSHISGGMILSIQHDASVPIFFHNFRVGNTTTDI